jgi:iron complex outermembrane receptor protein
MFQPIHLPRKGGGKGRSLQITLWSTAFFLSLAASPSSAQEIDYGKYESLFSEAVTMSATGKPERVSDTPVLMDVITAEDIQRSGARDIPTLLNRLAGVDLNHLSTGSVELGIGGYQQAVGSRVMVLLNGRQIYFDGFGDVFWSAGPVNLAEVRQIEVIHGSQSALYGFNAVDGVINIVTFDPVNDPVNSATARVGNHAGRDLSASVTQSLGEGSGVRLSAAGDHSHDYGMIPTSPNDNFLRKNTNSRSASFDARFTLTNDDRLGLEAVHSDVSERANVYEIFYDARVITDSVKVSYTADTDIGHVNATSYYSSFHVPWSQADAIQSFGVADRSTVGQISDLFKIGSSDSFRLAGDARHDEMGASNLTYGTLSGDLGAGSAMWEHNFTPALSSVNAVRYDYFKLGRTGQALPLNLYPNAAFDRSLEGISTNSALIDKVTDVDTLRLSFARGVKLPTLADFGQVEHFLPQYGGTYHFGNPDLSSSAVYDYQAGWDRRIAELDAVDRLVLFHQMTMRHIGTPVSVINGSLVLGSDMATGSVADGIEWGLQHKAKDGLIWGANYTFERLHEHSDLGYSNPVPVNKANANIGYAWESWDADLAAAFTSATKGMVFSGVGTNPSLATERVKAFTTLSPRIAWHANDNVTVELAADSLWPYQDSVVQRMTATYYLSMTYRY